MKLISNLTALKHPRIPEIKWSMSFSHRVPTTDMFHISDPKDLSEIIRQCYDQSTISYQEEFLLFCLNRTNKIMGVFQISKGGMTGTVADPRIIIKAALDCAATAVVLSHNHPSGGLKPSIADEEITRKIKEACRCFDIQVMDHIIITEDGYFSFCEGGIL
jgi:DNA repair protein RadC